MGQITVRHDGSVSAGTRSAVGSIVSAINGAEASPRSGTINVTANHPIDQAKKSKKWKCGKTKNYRTILKVTARRESNGWQPAP
jgi:hypothetical protein